MKFKMENTLSKTIYQTVTEKKICLMAHVICGYPSLEENFKILEAIENSGVEIVEIQFPFSEPIADGPLFTKANQQSLQNGTTIENCFELVKEAHKRFSFKIIMMGYYNTLFNYGEERFCQRLKEVGGTGIIIPDIPFYEASHLKEICQKCDLSFIPLIAPVTPQNDYPAIFNQTAGFVYIVSRLGVTGSKTQFDTQNEEYFRFIKQQVNIPTGVGFGIKSRKDVQFLENKVDLAIIGTEILNIYLKNGQQSVQHFLSSLRDN